jgi:DNA topoisomerase VI subunit B
MTMMIANKLIVSDVGEGMIAASVPSLLTRMFRSSKSHERRHQVKHERHDNSSDRKRGGSSNKDDSVNSNGRFGIGVKALLMYAISTRPHTSGHLQVTTTYVCSTVHFSLVCYHH